ncbi:MAG: hypothetical protein KatS3mg118_1622 [Paracoccaceae bacterium]|nr:MAG: hypothetical protein KatS3mg118_1622 [Paracoccaceae bacterium]
MNLPHAMTAHFLSQADYAELLGSAFTARLWRALPAALSGPVRDRLATWPGAPAEDLPANRIAAGLHALARDGRCPEVAAAWPPGHGPLDRALRAAFRDHQDFLLPWLDHPPQTNEVARSGVLLGLVLILAARTGMPIELIEIGASAGLNLGLDGYSYDLGAAGIRKGNAVHIACDWRGAWPDPGTPLRIEARAGCDLAPIDPADRAMRERLIAWIWPDQTDRLARAEAALDAAAAAPWRVERAEAAAWLAGRLARPQPAGRLRVLMHSVMWQYLPESARAGIGAAMAAAGARATADRPLGWVRMEGDGIRDSAALGLTLWPAGQTLRCGRAGWHGGWAQWQG